MRKWHGIDVCIGRLSNCCPPCRRAHRAWGQLVLFAVPVCLYLAARFAFCGALRTDPRPFRLGGPCCGALDPPAGAVRQFFLNWLFPCVVAKTGLSVQRSSPETFPPLYQAGLYRPFGGPSAWRHHHLDRRGGGVEAAARVPVLRFALRVVSSFLTGSSLASPSSAYYGPPWPCRARSCRKDDLQDADRSFAAFRQ